MVNSNCRPVISLDGIFCFLSFSRFFALSTKHDLCHYLATLRIGKSKEGADVAFSIGIAVLTVKFATFCLELHQYARSIVGSTSQINLVRHVVFYFALTIDEHFLLLRVVKQLNLVRQADQRQVEHIDRINLAKVFLPEEEVET